MGRGRDGSGGLTGEFGDVRFHTATILILAHSFQDVRFSMPDGCMACVGLAYDMYPLLTWTEFCSMFAESKTCQKTFEQGRQIQAGEIDQPFKVRGSVKSENMIGVRLEQQYVALTSDEVLSTFQLPAEAFEDLRSIVLANEDGEPTTFYLFKPEKVMRLAKFFSERELVNTDLLLEPDNMLRKEQPLERYQVLCKEEVSSRNMGKANSKDPKKGSTTAAAKFMTVEEAKARALTIIAAREAAEQNPDSKPSEKDGEEAPLFVPIDKVESSASIAGTQKQPKAAPKKRSNPKAGGAPKKKTKTGQNEPLEEPSGAASVVGDENVGGGDPASSAEALAAVIKAKIGGDVKSVKNLDVSRMLRGEQLGRSIAGVFGPH